MPKGAKKTRRMPYSVEVDADEFEHNELFASEVWNDGERVDKSMEEIIIDAANCAARCVDGMCRGKPAFSYFVRRTMDDKTRTTND